MVFTQYLDRLGLDQAADERAIKRAYARELKQIDQEADAAGFQALRQAYEMALQWLKHKPAAVSFAPASRVPVLPLAVREQEYRTQSAAPVSAAPARDADTGDDPKQLGQAVYKVFRDYCDGMEAQGKEGDSLLWRKHLQQCASDDRLLNLAARAYFEFLVARLLANGWHAGHEGLFVAARQVFGWEKDRRRLIEFGQFGEWLNQAIDECEMFNHQQSADCSGQADAITRVREDGAPSRRELLTHVPHLRNMLRQFPAWTAVIASRPRIEQWIDMELAIPGWRRRLQFKKRSRDGGTSGGSNWWKIMLFIIVIRALISFFQAPATPHQPSAWNPSRFEKLTGDGAEKAKREESLYERAAGKFYVPPGTREIDPKLQPDPPLRPLPGRMLTDAERKAIGERIKFKAPAGFKGRYTVTFDIRLDGDGKIALLKQRTPSGLAELDRSTEKAIRASAPFSKEVSRSFGLWYQWDFSKHKTRDR